MTHHFNLTMDIYEVEGIQLLDNTSSNGLPYNRSGGMGDSGGSVAMEYDSVAMDYELDEYEMFKMMPYPGTIR